MWNRKKTTFFSRHYLRNRSTLDIGVSGYIGVLWHIPLGTPCIPETNHVPKVHNFAAILWLQ